MQSIFVKVVHWTKLQQQLWHLMYFSILTKKIIHDATEYNIYEIFFPNESVIFA